MAVREWLRRGTAIGLVLLAGALASPPSHAADLSAGIAVEPDSIDPHFHWFGGNLDLSFQIFEPLVGMSGDGALEPVLAASWKPLDDSTWEFDLRPGVKFQDGTPFTSADVAFTLKRAPDVPRSPGGFGSYLRPITGVETPDPLRVIIHTNGPVPLMPTYLSRIGIISQHAGANATTDQYNTGAAAIGTGPYRFVSWAHGDLVTLKRNEAYWGKQPDWDNVRLRYIPNPAARVAALLAVDVDLVDSVSVEDVARLKQNTALRMRDTPASNLIALQLDTSQRKPPFFSGPNGEALDKNPLADLRVRKALAMAVNREALKERVLNNEVATAEQVMAPGQFGYDPTLKPLPNDPVQAKKLLAEAGFPNGLRMTIQCQSDRYPNGPGVCQALAQMFTRIGIRTTPEPTPHNMFITHANQHDYSVFDVFMLPDTAEPGQALALSFGTHNEVKARGGLNRGQYSNPALDDLLDTATHQVDATQREATLRQAVALVGNDVAWIPLFRPLNIEAMRIGLDHTPRADGFVFAADVHPAAAKATP